MTRALILVLVSSLALTACSSVRDSRINPMNWFGSAEPARPTEATGPDGAADTGTATTTEADNPLIPKRRGKGLLSLGLELGLGGDEAAAPYAGIPAQRITALRVDRTAGGAVVTVEGLAERQGAHDVRLVEAARDNGTLVLVLKLVYPSEPTPQGPPSTRSVVAGLKLTDQDLEGIRAIRVEARDNALVVRR